MAVVDTHDGESIQGSSYLTLTSYSGADIKVLIHIYNPASSSALSASVAPSQIADLEKKYDQLTKQIDGINKKWATTKNGTPADKAYKKQMTSLQAQVQQISSTLQSVKGSSSDHDSRNLESGTTKVLMELQTLSISVHRDKQAVRALGSVYPKGFVRGPREIAGTMVATTFDQHVFYDLMQSHPSDFDGVAYTSAITDQIPPMDLTIAFANELGSISRMALYAVEFLNEGMVLSIQDILTESTFNFVARDFDPMRAVDQRVLDANNQLTAQWQGKRASELIFESDYQNTKLASDPFERFSRRNNPYV